MTETGEEVVVARTRCNHCSGLSDRLGGTECGKKVILPLDKWPSPMREFEKCRGELRPLSEYAVAIGFAW